MRSTEQILAGDWAIDAARLESFANDVKAAAVAPVEGKGSPITEPEPAPTGDVAVVKMHGTVLKSSPEWLDFFGIASIDATNTAEVMTMLAANPDISKIVLDIDSPGGEVGGTDALAGAVAEAAKQKPVIAYVSGMAASAAYWVAAQATAIVSERTAKVGSIGVYSVIADTSEAAKAQGVKVHVVSSGELKGAGQPGTEVTEEQLNEVQEHVNALGEIFFEAVAEGRGLEIGAVRKLATGKVWLSGQAVELGLVDKVGSLQDALAFDVEGEDMTEKADTSAEEVEEETAASEASEAPQAQEAEAPKAADEEEDEEEEDEDDMKAELAKANARADAAEAALREIKEGQKSELISNAQAAGRVTPNLLKSVTDFSAACGDDVERLRSFVGALPVATHSAPTGSTDEPGGKLSAEQIKFAKKFGMTPEEFARGAEGAEV